MAVMREYHATLGTIITSLKARWRDLWATGIMVVFGDPIPCPDPCARAVLMAVAMRRRLSELSSKWRRERQRTRFGVGIAYGYATIGAIGFEGRSDYARSEPWSILAARLCSDARDGQILIDGNVRAALDGRATAEPVGELILKGLHRPIEAFNV